MQERFEGIVIWYDADNGYGIIQIQSVKKTVTIHDCQIHHSRSKGIRSLHVGQAVSFEVVCTEAHDLYIL